MTIETVDQNNNHAANVLARMTTQIEGMDLRTMGTVLVKSGYFQDTKEIAQAIVKVLAGKELGFGPIASMQGVYIVNGRVSLASNLIAAAIQRSGRFRYRVASLDSTACSIRFYERSDQGNWQDVGESTFSEKDAETADLIKNATYKRFPRNMLFARALTNGARWYCPEVFNGPVYTPDELGANVDDEGRVIDIEDAQPVPTREQDPAERRAALWARNRELVEECRKRGLQGVPTLNVRSTEDALAEANQQLEQRIENQELDQQALKASSQPAF